MRARVTFMVVLGWAWWVAAEPPSQSSNAAAEPPRRWEVADVTQRSETRLRIAAGWFERGSDAAEIERALALCKTTGTPCEAATFAGERPVQRVFVRAFAIDRLEVSNAQYQRCVNAGRCLPPREDSARADHPVTHITFAEARAYCRFAGGDLPSEAQWEYAAHGDSRRSFPWGESWNPQLGNFAPAASELHAVSAHVDGKSFFGLLNMAGNVWELTLDRYRAPYASDLPSVDPIASSGPGSERVLRGGSWKSPAHTLRARYRAAIREDEARADVGMRCAYSAR